MCRSQWSDHKVHDAGAETVPNNLAAEMNFFLIKEIGLYEFSKWGGIIEDNLYYDNFCRKLEENKELGKST